MSSPIDAFVDKLRVAYAFKLIVKVLFVAALVTFLITTNVRWVINAPILYSYGFDKYDIPTRTGLERSELLSAARQIRRYFNNSEEFINIRVRMKGIRVANLYGEREILHMKDVKVLIKGVYRLQEMSGLYLLLFTIIGLLKVQNGFICNLARCIKMGGLLTITLLVVAGLLAAVGFDRLFLAFHLVSFSNDYWQLDPSRHYLIAMFPERFFLDATMWIGGGAMLMASLVTGVSVMVLWWGRSQRTVASSDGWCITRESR